LYICKNTFKETKLLHIEPLFNKFTYGIEFESTNGTIPMRFCRKHGLVPVRDGSVAGLEYVTIPITGLSGMENLKEICDLLKTHTIYDRNCALHFHIGGIPRTESFILALFKILAIVEEDVFQMFPFYKRVNHGVKRKSYTKPLPFPELLSQMTPTSTKKEDIIHNFSILFSYLSMGYKFDDDNINCKLENVKYHPSDPGNNSKWNMKTRYHWVNLIPIIFGNKQTVEFRIHTPTYEYCKVLSFLIFISIIVNYAMVYEKNINSDSTILRYLNLNNIITSSIDSLISDANPLKSIIVDFAIGEVRNYIKNRQNYISRCMNSPKSNQLAPESEYRMFSNWSSKKYEEKNADNPYLRAKIRNFITEDDII
jgi:hypothetical protein